MDGPDEILIEVSTDYLADESDPGDEHFVFAYTINIENRGAVAARLLSRHWVITDANGHIQEVHGDGVVGEHPYIAPGEAFRYSSGVYLETPVGTMQGSYQMVDDAGRTFAAEIVAFTLAVPGTLH